MSRVEPGPATAGVYVRGNRGQRSFDGELSVDVRAKDDGGDSESGEFLRSDQRAQAAERLAHSGGRTLSLHVLGFVESGLVDVYVDIKFPGQDGLHSFLDAIRAAATPASIYQELMQEMKPEVEEEDAPWSCAHCGREFRSTDDVAHMDDLGLEKASDLMTSTDLHVDCVQAYAESVYRLFDNLGFLDASKADRT